MSDAWTADPTAYLLDLFAAGNHTSQEMADAIGEKFDCVLTRSAVIGKLSRMGLKRGRKAGIRITIPGAPIFPALEPQTSPEAAPAPSGAHQCDIMGLVNASCRYPVTAEPPHLYCGAPEADLIGGVPYCRFHACIAFNGKPERKPKPDHPPAGDTWMPLGAAAHNVVAGLKG